MRKLDQYLSTIDTIYPDSYVRESYFRDAGGMLEPQPLRYPHEGGVLSRLVSAWRTWSVKRRGRAVLRELSSHGLEDIGVTRAEARREIAKSWFFD